MTEWINAMAAASLFMVAIGIWQIVLQIKYLIFVLEKVAL